jgi:predicted Zn-dependent peptidase
MKKMVKGDFSDDLLEEAKSTYKSMLITAMDYPANLVNNYYDNQIDNISLFKDRMDDINKVSIEDIKKIASKIKMNTIFLFGGDSK